MDMSDMDSLCSARGSQGSATTLFSARGSDNGAGVAWQHQGRSGWHCFPSSVSAAVEKDHQSGQPNTTFLIGDASYILDFRTMRQFSSDDPSRYRRVRRTIAGEERRMMPRDEPHWLYEDQNGWIRFSRDLNELVEPAYQAGAVVLRTDIRGTPYDLDLEGLKQHSLLDHTRSRRIRRVPRGHREAGSGHRSAVTSLVLGVRVQRGQDWAHGDQDGGSGLAGTTIPSAGSSPGWIGVAWDSGSEQVYRIGAEGKYELSMAARLPPSWNIRPSTPIAQHDCAQDCVDLIQNLFDKTYSHKATRDRRDGPVPPKFTVTSVKRNENLVTWQDYMSTCHKVQGACMSDTANAKWPWKPVQTSQAQLEIRKLNRKCNEVYLLHGADQSSVNEIAHNSFKLSCAKDGLLGKLCYFAESVTKADEYSRPDAQGQHMLLICRAVLGAVRFTNEVQPDKAALHADLASGKFHSVLADREATSGYREFGINDTTQVFPEYLVMYRRG